MTAGWLWPGLVLRTRRSCGRADGTAAPWWRSTPGASPPAGWNDGYEPAILWGGDSADSPAALGFGPAWFGTRWAADVAERIEDSGPRLLSAPRRIYLGDRPGEPGLTGRTGGYPGLHIPYPPSPTNCLARTRSTGYPRGPVLPGRRGCPAQAVSARSAGDHEQGAGSVLDTRFSAAPRAIANTRWERLQGDMGDILSVPG